MAGAISAALTGIGVGRVHLVMGRTWWWATSKADAEKQPRECPRASDSGGKI